MRFYLFSVLLVPIAAVSAYGIGRDAAYERATAEHDISARSVSLQEREYSSGQRHSSPLAKRLEPHEIANNLIHQADALYVEVGTMRQIQIGTNGQNVIGSSGFGACHAVAIKVGLHVAVGHIMDLTPEIRNHIVQWAHTAAQHGGRAWIWVPQVNGHDENVKMVHDLQTALQGAHVTKVTRQRSQTLQPSAMTAMCVTNHFIILGDHREDF